MCGRFSQEAELSEIKLELQIEQLELFREFRPAFNIAPSHSGGSEQAFAIQTSEGRRVLRLGRWWLIPHFWSQPLKQLPAAFNARAEELAQKPFWRDAFRQRRCLVPATGWREFQAEGKHKQPYQFRLAEPLFAFAGLWSRWRSPDDELVESFAIVTSEPSALAAPYHDRMPLVVPSGSYHRWLDPEADPQAALLEVRRNSQSLALDIFPTNPLGNNVHFEGPQVVERIDLAAAREARARQPVKTRPPRSAPRPPHAGSELRQGDLFGGADQPATSSRKAGR